MGLEDSHQASGLERARRAKRRFDLRWVMGVILVHERPTRAGAQQLEAPAGAAKGLQTGDRELGVRACHPNCLERADGVQRVVRTWDLQADLVAAPAKARPTALEPRIGHVVAHELDGGPSDSLLTGRNG